MGQHMSYECCQTVSRHCQTVTQRNNENDRHTIQSAPCADGTTAGGASRRKPSQQQFSTGSSAKSQRFGGRLVVQPHAHRCETRGATTGSKSSSMKQVCKKRPTIVLHTRRVVAIFGRAKLMRERDGRFQLEGGSHHDEAAAIEWASMFMPEAVLGQPRQTSR